MTTSSIRGRRLPALDGLRALAVLAVVAYHLGYGWARGGYLGVDLFFVLSGFLITSLLLEEHEERGTIALGQFWARRARRLLPALFAMVVAVMAFVLIEGRYGRTDVVAGIDLHSLRDQALATLAYVANWQDILSQHSYFAQFSAPSPLQHTWSLAIEEQFYLVWPFVTLALLAKGLVQRRRVGIVVSIAIAIGSTVLMGVLFTPGTDPSRVYYGTDTRLADLAVGAVLAWITAERPATPARIATWLRVIAPLAFCGLVALMVVAGTSGEIPSDYMFEGGFLAASILCAIVIADVRREGSLLARGLSWRPLVEIGLVSYGIYLWHWPVIVLVTPTSVSLSGVPLLMARLAIIAALVLASYVLIEQPVRRRTLAASLRRVVYPVAVCATVAAVFIGTTASLVVHTYVRATLERYAPTSVPAGSGGVIGAPIRIGHVIDRADPLRIVIIGDSMVDVAGPGIVAALDATGVVVASNDEFPGWGTTTDSTWPSYVRGAVRSTHADVVVVTTGWDGAEARSHPTGYLATLERLVADARAAGAAGVVFLQYPVTDPSLDTTAASRAATHEGIAAWNAVAAKVPTADEGHALYFPVASSVELDGQFSAWLAPPRDPRAPESTWDRVRRLDGVHLCPAGIELYAAAIAADAAAAWHLPSPAPQWWVDGWQRAEVITSGDQYCPDDHPPG